MTTDDDAIQIRALLQEQARAIHAKDADAAFAPYAPDVVRFDLAPPLAISDRRALSKTDMKAWFATWDGPIGFDLRDLSWTLALLGRRRAGVQGHEAGPIRA